MLKSTFCHLQGIGAGSEQKLWDAGVHSWEQALDAPASALGRSADKIRRGAEESLSRLQSADAAWFGAKLPANQQWRLFDSFRTRVAYVDIETTGLAWPAAHITTIALYDGEQVKTYVHDRNLHEFMDDIRAYDLLVTFNGKCFDVPFIEQALEMRLDIGHIDLRYVFRALGVSGGLKRIEHFYGMDRGELEGVDGYMAVLLWKLFRRTADEKVLETLLAYNVEDVLTLEPLMHQAYNEHLVSTPFGISGSLTIPSLAANPFSATPQVIAAARSGGSFVC
ncbi:ribonuclease H-like domain-containing protein [Oleidesulfovibrio sp.]|uniref:ribonuclease H-like domain-containing protein n=1 Tax=Oleidesulfovibrio sp. TaxID=2909707 RepID=UPI003A835D39